MAKCYPFLGKFKVTSQFGQRAPVKTTSGSTTGTYHYGIDLVNVSGSSNVIVSATEGTVIAVKNDPSYGNYVYTKNNDGTACLYAHLASVSVKVGQTVSCKTKIGIMGATGETDGAHLHFGVSTDPDLHGNLRPLLKYFVNPGIWYNIDYFNIVGKVFDGTQMVSSTSVETTVVKDTTVKQEVVRDVIPSGQIYEVTDLKGTTSDILFGRRYRILIDLGNNKALDVSDMRCVFEIVKTWERQANQSTVTIYNLSPDTENLLIKEGQKIIIEAGYVGSQYGKIFEGNIIQPLREKENGTDYKLTLVSMDSDKYVTYGLIGVSMTAEQTSRDAINTLTQKASVVSEVNYMPSTDIIYPRGKVMFGKASTYLSQIAKSQNATYYNNNGKVNIVTVEGLPDKEILDLGPESGLLGTPSQYQYGIEGSCLLNPRIDIETYIHVDNTKVKNYRYSQGEAIRALDSQGIYRVVKLTHKGDTRGGQWATEFQAISQSGMLPGITALQDAYIY